MMYEQISRRGFLVLTSALASAAAMPSLADAAFPTKPVRLVIPYPPGGSADVLGRLLAEAITGPLGQPVVVENRGGAGGNVAAQFVSKAAPDGYTLILGNAPVLTINPYLYKSTGFDSVKDFAPVTPLAGVPLFLLVNDKAPFQSIGDFVAWAKSNPKKLNYASGSTGSLTHLSMEMFFTAAGIHGVHVPYKGSGPALTGLMGGDVPTMFELLPSAMPFVTSGKLKAIAVTSATRQDSFPDVPTVAESGYPGFEASSWFGVLAPAGTPEAVVEKLNKVIVSTVTAPTFRSRLRELGAVPIDGGPAEFSKMIRSELAKWGPVVRSTGASAQ